MSRLKIGLVTSCSQESELLVKLLEKQGAELVHNITPEHILSQHAEDTNLHVWLLNVDDDSWHDAVDHLLDESEVPVYFSEPGILAKQSHPEYWCKNLLDRLYEITGLKKQTDAFLSEQVESSEDELVSKNTNQIALNNNKNIESELTEAVVDSVNQDIVPLSTSLDELELSTVGLPSDIAAELVNELESLSPVLNHQSEVEVEVIDNLNFAENSSSQAIQIAADKLETDQLMNADDVAFDGLIDADTDTEAVVEQFDDADIESEELELDNLDLDTLDLDTLELEDIDVESSTASDIDDFVDDVAISDENILDDIPLNETEAVLDENTEGNLSENNSLAPLSASTDVAETETETEYESKPDVVDAEMTNVQSDESELVSEQISENFDDTSLLIDEEIPLLSQQPDQVNQQPLAAAEELDIEQAIPSIHHQQTELSFEPTAANVEACSLDDIDSVSEQNQTDDEPLEQLISETESFFDSDDLKKSFTIENNLSLNDEDKYELMADLIADYSSEIEAVINQSEQNEGIEHRDLIEQINPEDKLVIPENTDISDDIAQEKSPIETLELETIEVETSDDNLENSIDLEDSRDVDEVNPLDTKESDSEIGAEVTADVINETFDFYIPMLDETVSDIDFEVNVPIKAETKKLTPCWVIAASLGGPAAVKRFMQCIPADINASFIIVQHIDENFLPVLAEILTSNSPFEVSIAKGSHEMSAGKVYIAPLNGKIDFLTDGSLLIDHSQKWSAPYSPCIDDVIKSVSFTYGHLAGAIIFSGMGEDGLNGVKKMREQGGLVWAQSPQTCANSSMPDAVINNQQVDFVGTPEELAEKLVSYLG